MGNIRTNVKKPTLWSVGILVKLNFWKIESVAVDLFLFCLFLSCRYSRRLELLDVSQVR